MAYGDILEINGQFVEHTPVGYMPLSPERAEGMLTKPAPITKTTTPTQTLPIGTPTTDPNKAPAGETGGFDPNGGPIGGPPALSPTLTPTAAPTVAPALALETGGIKPMQDVKDEPEAPAEMTFTFVEGRESGDAQQNYLYGQTGETQQATVEQLRSYFENDEVNRLSEQFGSFDNYLAYMTEREQLIQSGDYDVGNWSEADTGFTEDQQMIFEGDADLTIDASDPGQDITNLTRQVRNTQAGAYNNWLNSEANQALLEKYGVSGTVYSESGDKFQWNGSAYVKVVDEDKVSMGDYARMAMGVAVGSMLGPALGNLATGATTAGTAAGTAAGTTAATTAGSFAQGAVNATLGSAISQGIATGSVDASQLVVAGITGGIGGVVDAVNAGDLVGTEIDNAIWDLSDQLNIAPAEVTEILQGAVNGAITGADVESIVQGAVSGYTTGKIKSTLNGLYGSEIDVENVFDEGTTSIATASLDPFIETAVDAAFEGEIQGEDVLEALLDFATYEDELGYEGSLAFLDPTKAFGEDSDLFGDTPQFIKEIEDVVRAAGSEAEDITRAVGSYVDDNVIQPIRDALPEETPEAIKEIEDFAREVGSELEDVVRNAGSEAEDITRAVGSYVDDNVIQPIREAIPSGTTPDITLPEGPDINVPDVDLPSLPNISFPSISVGMLGGSTAPRQFQSVDPGGITYDPVRQEMVMLGQQQKPLSAVEQLEEFFKRQPQTQSIGSGMFSV